VSGTSASSPVVAGMVSLVNAQRLEAGKGPLGFLNTAIYQNGATFANDVTSGENNCCASAVCCDEGFYASTGWDPLTGFGSVNYAKFAAIFANL
ncbi:peptidase S8/S53 domain-containing protein, partial [Ochromonadaceae sp. CCMP2298]